MLIEGVPNKEGENKPSIWNPINPTNVTDKVATSEGARFLNNGKPAAVIIKVVKLEDAKVKGDSDLKLVQKKLAWSVKEYVFQAIWRIVSCFIFCFTLTLFLVTSPYDLLQRTATEH